MTSAKAVPKLSEDDLLPLVQATASRSLDTCLRGARGLAMMGDPRALGLLLQLSREQDPAARAEVCRALAALDDPRAADRLRSMLYDPDAAVRDTAFSSLARLQASEPLAAAAAGLSAAAEDVRRRGLEALVRFLRDSPADAGRAGPPLELLARALNDSSSAVRGEAFKSAFNLKAGGGGLHTLRYLLQSVHADVRREVLTEVIAQAAQPWAWNLLLEFTNDPDPRLREEAFDAAVRRNKDLPPLETALLSQYPDVRKFAVEVLVKKHTPSAQALLVKAVADADKEVRQTALVALVGEDARGRLVEALASPHADVRVRAARALARHGDASSLPTLLALATATEPPEKERVADWTALVESALDGLAELGDGQALSSLVPLLRSRHASIRKQAARALGWVALPHHTETLRTALQHEDAAVKYRAALGLAWTGDPLVAALVFSDAAGNVLTKDEQISAALGLGAAGADRLALFLDDADEAVRTRALVLHMLLELASGQVVPTRCLTCLSARPPRMRLSAARGLESFADPARFRDFVVRLLNDRGDDPPWKVPAETVGALALLLAQGSPAARVRTVDQLRHLAEKEPAAWEQGWSLLSERLAVELRTLKEVAAERKPGPPQYTPEQLEELAFGAYIGLVREQGGSAAAGFGTEAQVIRARQTALSRLQEMATAGGRRTAAIPVLVQALGDPNQAVRLQAFDQLDALKLEIDALGAAALGAGHTDVGVRGLEKLAGGGHSAEGQAVLAKALRTRTDDLATEAAKLLAIRRGRVAVAALSLAAAHEPLRALAVDWLAEDYDRTPAAREALRQALSSRHRKVASSAAFALALKKDSAAFAALVKFLNETKDAGPQRRMIAALQELGDPRAADAFLDRIEKDPEGTALTGELFEAVGVFRRVESVDRLLKMAAAKEAWRDGALGAARVISGFDQEVDDPNEERSDRRWEQRQLPRHPAVLARMLQTALDLKALGVIRDCLAGARWARGPEVDPVLALLAFHADDELRHDAVEILGWRLRKRSGPADALLKLLKHRDPQTQFLAAEGLGRAGRTEALAPLLAAVELQDDETMRSRAVGALGELGDPKALDLLMKIVNDPDHALRLEAAEALGHMRRSPRAHEILDLLQNFARGDNELTERALRGLRWFDHPDGWQLIRRRAADADFAFQPIAIELLAFNDDPATRALLLKHLAESVDYWFLQGALESARKLWGEESLDPDYALIRNETTLDEVTDVVYRRLHERGDARRLLEILPRVPAAAAGRLKGILLGRQPLPVAEAQTVVAGPDAAAAGVAAHLLGRAGEASAGTAVAAALKRWWDEWDRGRTDEARRGLPPGGAVGPLLESLRSLTWAAGRLGVGADTLAAMAAARSGQVFDRPLRREAVTALTMLPTSKATQAALEAVCDGDDPEIRALAASALSTSAPARVAQRLLSDRVAFNRVARADGNALTETLRTAAGQVHAQGVAVPHLAARADVTTLAAVADDNALSEEARLGAVEGLAAIGTAEAETRLAAVGKSAGNPEELRKAAWRGRRRSIRARKIKETAS